MTRALPRPRPLARRAATTIGALALVAACGACGGSAAKASPPTQIAPSTTAKPNPSYDSGATVIITATGFQPKELIAMVKVPLTFVNHTTTVARVQFEHSRDAAGRLRASGPIPPGGKWSYTPQTWESATYHSVGQPALRGQIQIQPPAEP
jgi:hypothetical protein